MKLFSKNKAFMVALTLTIFPIQCKGLEEDHKFKLGIEAMNYSYKEFVNNEKFMSLNGPLYGVVVEYSYNEPGIDFFVDLNSRFLRGTQKYNGCMVDLNSGNRKPLTIKGVDNILMEGNGHFGYKTDFLQIYSGIGYRQKSDSSIEIGYPDRKSQYSYIPLGIRMIANIDNTNIFIAPYLEYDFLWKASHSTKYLYYGNITVKQRKGFGSKMGIKCKYGKLELTPYFNYWNIKDSDRYVNKSTNFWMYEPKNITKEIGLKISIEL
jgi:hypothetical protein